MVGLSRTRRLIAILLVLAAAGGTVARLAAQEPLRSPRTSPADAKPILVDSDEVITWMEDGKRILLLKGHVLVQQGITQARFDAGVLWVDVAGYQRTRVMHVDAYAEGNVLVESGGEPRRGPRATFELNTRGEFRLYSHRSKAVQEVRRDDPLYRRAVGERTPPPAPPPAENPPQAQTITDPHLLQTQFSNQLPPGSGRPSQTQTPGERPVIPGVPVNPITPETAPPPRRRQPPPRPAPPVPAQGPAPLRQFSIAPRTPSQPYQARIETLPSGEQALVVTGGVILLVRDVRGVGLIDIEADRLVLWSHGQSPQFFENLRTPRGEHGRELEFYLAGNVEVRQESATTHEARTLRASEMYYDVSRNVAVAVSADLEFKQPGLPYPVHMRADEIFQLSETKFEAEHAVVFSSRLPSDPGLTVFVRHATLEEKKVPKRTLFGGVVTDPKTGQPETEPQSLVRGDTVLIRVGPVPVFYLPYIQTDARDPLGPIEDVNVGFNRVFGFRIGTTLDLYDLLGLDPLPGTRWRLDADYLTSRGPALGTNFEYAGNKLFGVPAHYTGLFKAWGLHDTGQDILGGGRGENDEHPNWRGRLFWRQLVRELPYGFSVTSQVSALSDRNFLEQFFKPEFDLDYNQETFTYIKQAQDNWSWTLLAETRLFDWMTQTRWLPRADGYLLGQSFFQTLTYNAWANVGFAQLRPAIGGAAPPVFPTDVRDDTGRFDFWQELSLPFYLGPLRLAPYGVIDLTEYTRDLDHDETGRVYGGGGVRASIPFSRLYPNVESLFFNVNGIYHKVELSANYYLAQTNVPFGRLPQLDRLNDDVTDQALRDITPLQTALNPHFRDGLALATLPLFNPQTYAIRRLVMDRVDTRDDIEVLQLDLRQRWQTKRGYPGQQHIVDWMVLDLSGSYFPAANRDNFGEHFAFLEYNWLWNVGDRTGLASSGWVDPIDFGARVFTIGAFLNRPDRTNFFLGYRQIDPVNSKAVTGSVSYVLSPKYAVTGASTYDFGTSLALSNSLIVTRMGKDLQVALGVTYNALQNNFGLLVQVLPNLAAQRGGQIFGVPTTGTRALGGLW